MKRTPEPELMLDSKQAEAYYKSDRNNTKIFFRTIYKAVKKLTPATLVDLGCGTGEITEMLATMHPTTKITGIDNSQAMINLTKNHDNVVFKKMAITEITDNYQRVVSSLALHHFIEPGQFWESVKRINPVDVLIFDFLRPESEKELEIIIKEKEPFEYELFKIDFENSLRASFTLEEIKQQLLDHNLNLDIHKFNPPGSQLSMIIIGGVL
jgi:trans-aconitate methyltransferase